MNNIIIQYTIVAIIILIAIISIAYSKSNKKNRKSAYCCSGCTLSSSCKTYKIKNTNSSPCDASTAKNSQYSAKQYTQPEQ